MAVQAPPLGLVPDSRLAHTINGFAGADRIGVSRRTAAAVVRLPMGSIRMGGCPVASGRAADERAEAGEGMGAGAVADPDAALCRGPGARRRAAP